VRSCLVITHIASESTEIYLIIVAMLMVSMAQPLLFSSQLFFLPNTNQSLLTYQLQV
jgi:hypothetical protein